MELPRRSRSRTIILDWVRAVDRPLLPCFQRTAKDDVVDWVDHRHVLLLLVFLGYGLIPEGQEQEATYRVSRSMTGNKINMEIDYVPSLKRVKTRFVIFVLVSSADIGIAVVISVGNFNSIFDGAGEVLFKTGIRLTDMSSKRGSIPYLCSILSTLQPHRVPQIMPQPGHVLSASYYVPQGNECRTFLGVGVLTTACARAPTAPREKRAAWRSMVPGRCLAYCLLEVYWREVKCGRDNGSFLCFTRS